MAYNKLLLSLGLMVSRFGSVWFGHVFGRFGGPGQEFPLFWNIVALFTCFCTYERFGSDCEQSQVGSMGPAQ